MTSHHPLVAELVQVGTGNGLLARRPDGVLFVDDGSIASRPAMIAAFTNAVDGISALDDVLRVAADEELRVGAFAIVVWRPSVHVVVFGDLVLHTDLPSLPRLAGTDLGTWVEHRTLRPPQRCEVRLGTTTVPGTDLAGGVVPAGAFRIVLVTDPATEPAPAPLAAGDRAVAPKPADTSTPMPVVAPPAAPPHAQLEPPPPVAMPRPAAAAASWDVLRDAGGGWMEESLQISDDVRTARDPAPAPAAGTSGPTDPTAATPRSDPSGASDASDGSDGSIAFDPEVTLDPRRVAPPPPREASPPSLPPPSARMVQARRCDLSHLNPPLRTQCRTCGHYIPPATPVETVPQPVLATVLLPDGRAIDVRGSIVIGRQPSSDAARLEESGEIVVIEGDPSVSRTHVVVGVDGWTLLATDCAATAGTAIAQAGAEPVLLEAWVPHEIGPGTTLFLGGRTQLRVVAAR